MATTDDTLIPAAAAATESGGARVKAWYALILLMLINTLSLLDRKIPFVMIDQIREDFALTDTQVGLLGGVIFTVVYSLLGFPLARLADRMSRKAIVSGALFVWSGLTALSGFSNSFAHFAAARIGLAAGEAGCVPPSHSMVADYFPLRNRGMAMSIYQAGGALGLIGGLAVGGALAESLGWRGALYVVGGIGMALAVITALTLKEPRRGHSDGVESAEKVSFGEALKAMWARRSFKYLTFAGCFFTAATAPILTFTPSYLTRSLNFTTAEAGLYAGLILGLSTGLGTLAGGWISSIIGKTDPRRTLWMGAAGMALGTPLVLMALNTDVRALLVVLLATPLFLASLYLGPNYGFAQGMVPPGIRATTAAVMVFVIHGIGASLGAWLAGMLSDHFTELYGTGGLRLALMVTSGFYALAAICLMLASRTLRADLDSIRRPSGS